MSKKFAALVEEYRKLFTQINKDFPEEAVPLSPEHAVYYAGQISNLNESWSGTKCLVLAKAVCAV